MIFFLIYKSCYLHYYYYFLKTSKKKAESRLEAMKEAGGTFLNVTTIFIDIFITC